MSKYDKVIDFFGGEIIPVEKAITYYNKKLQETKIQIKKQLEGLLEIENNTGNGGNTISETKANLKIYCESIIENWEQL